MKKLILAFVALAFAFAISSCCDQNRCPTNMRNCNDADVKMRPDRNGEERPYRWDRNTQQQQMQQQPERDRRW